MVYFHEAMPVPPPKPSAIHVGHVIGGCRIESLIGRGGMGAVYEAYQVSLQRKVAIKVLKTAENSAQEASQTKLIQEARLAAKLNHPNIVQIFDVGEERGIYFMIMEYVEGVTLKDLLRNQPVFPLDRLYRVALKVARGLSVAHENHVVHRDIKPENIMLTSSGEVKIMDFGAASFLLNEQNPKENLVGTPPYVAPEVIRREPSDGRADMYALGIMLHSSVTGVHPFPAKTAKEMLQAHLQLVPPPLRTLRPEIHEGLAQAIEKLCSKKPHERLSSEEFLDLLEVHPEWGKVASSQIARRNFLKLGDTSSFVQRPAGPGPQPQSSIPPPAAPSAPASPAPKPPSSAPQLPKADPGKKSILDAPLLRDRRGEGAPPPPSSAPLSPPTPPPSKAPSGSFRVDQPFRPIERSALVLRGRDSYYIERAKELSPPPTAEPPGPPGPQADELSVQELCVQARYKLMNKNSREAESLFRQALHLEPQNEEALLGLARLLTEESRYDEAVAELRTAFQGGKLDTKKILGSRYFLALRDKKEFRRLMAEYSL